MCKRPYNILVIAGSDSCSGAGIQADLKAVTFMGGYCCTAITAVTAQNTVGVSSLYLLPVNIVVSQIKAIIADLKIDAIKIGMLGSKAIISNVAKIIATSNLSIPVVVDPVMVATSGDSLLTKDAVACLKQELIPQATLLTPNIPEALALLGDNYHCDSVACMHKLIKPLLFLGAGAVLLKGGHLQTKNQKVDLLATGDKTHKVVANNVNLGAEMHGTGCTLASAITALLAQGASLIDAVLQAKQYLQQVMINAKTTPKGSGSIILNHAYSLNTDYKVKL
jgi:hydroxymethylpyrimidine/phosphomethylpyrimidine kinase